MAAGFLISLRSGGAFSGLESTQPPRCGFQGVRVNIDPKVGTAKLLGGHKSRPASAHGIDDKPTGRRKALDEVRGLGFGLLPLMVVLLFAAAIDEVPHRLPPGLKRLLVAGDDWLPADEDVELAEPHLPARVPHGK